MFPARLILTTLIVFTALALFSCTKQENESAQQTEEQTPMATDDRPLAKVTPPARENYYSRPPEMSIDDSKRYTATIHTDKGQIVMELDALYAPQHTNNFVFLARQGFFDGLTFHRYDPGFVIQGGDPRGIGTGGPGYKISAEIGLPHQQGALAMARQPDEVNPEKKSSGSQFYITLEATSFLDGDYSVFGKVIQGFEVVEQIRKGDIMQQVDIEEN